MPYKEKIDQLVDAWDNYPRQPRLRFFILKNDSLVVTVTNYGLRIVHLFTADKNKKPVDIIVGPENPEDFFASNNPYYGAIIGRFANRIDKGSFQLNGESYQLECNNGPNHLHGGSNGLHQQVWNCIFESKHKLTFTHTSPHLSENYPGTLQFEVSIELDENFLKISYSAVTDRTTIINLTHHPFFNLDGCGTAGFESHELQLEADQYLPLTTDMIPQGFLSSVTSTPFDFTTPASITKRLQQRHEQLTIGNGFDHTFVRRNYSSADVGLIASVYSTLNGILMHIYTTEPGVQLYTGNFMDGVNKIKDGAFDLLRSAFCLEAQHFPNSPNQTEFPNVVLKPHETYRSTTVFEFLITQ